MSNEHEKDQEEWSEEGNKRFTMKSYQFERARIVFIGITLIRIIICCCALVGAVIYQIRFFGVVNNATLHLLEGEESSRTYSAMRFSLVLSMGSLCSMAFLLMLVGITSVTFALVRWYYMMALSETVNSALTFLLLIFCVFNVNLGLHSSEISSNIIGNIASSIQNDKQVILSTVDHIQESLHCCGFHTGVGDWSADITAKYYDPFERKSVIVRNGETKRMWYAMCSENQQCIAPRSCCKTNTENCNILSTTTTRTDLSNVTTTLRNRMEPSSALYEQSCFAAFGDSIETFSYQTSVFALAHLVTAALTQAIAHLIIARIDGAGTFNLLTGTMNAVYDSSIIQTLSSRKREQSLSGSRKRTCKGQPKIVPTKERIDNPETNTHSKFKGSSTSQ